MIGRLITIAEFENTLEAQLAKAGLQSNGIRATVVGQTIHNLLPADGMLNVQLKILDSDIEKAKTVLNSLLPNKSFEGEN
jgi:hypothetical protein